MNTDIHGLSMARKSYTIYFQGELQPSANQMVYLCQSVFIRG